MDAKVKWLEELEGFKGVVIHPDEIRKSKAYGKGALGHLELKSLTLAFNSFSKRWAKRLTKERRGKFIFRFTDGSPETARATRSDQVLLDDASKRALIQVVGSPRFPQSHFEQLHKMHPSTFAMIPAAAMAIRVMDMEEVENKNGNDLLEAFDWAYDFTDPLTPGLVKLSRKDLEKRLNEILETLRSTKKVAFWQDIPISHYVKPDNERRLEVASYGNRLFDIVFTTGIGRRSLTLIQSLSPDTLLPRCRF